MPAARSITGCPGLTRTTGQGADAPSRVRRSAGACGAGGCPSDVSLRPSPASALRPAPAKRCHGDPSCSRTTASIKLRSRAWYGVDSTNIIRRSNVARLSWRTGTSASRRGNGLDAFHHDPRISWWRATQLGEPLLTTARLCAAPRERPLSLRCCLSQWARDVASSRSVAGWIQAPSRRPDTDCA